LRIQARHNVTRAINADVERAIDTVNRFSSFEDRIEPS